MSLNICFSEKDKILNKYLKWYTNKYLKLPSEEDIDKFKREGYWIIKGFMSTFSLSNSFDKWAGDNI